MTGAVSRISSRAVEVIIGAHKQPVALDGRGVRLEEARARCHLRVSSNSGRATWDRCMRSGLRAQVPTAPDSHAS